MRCVFKKIRILTVAGLVFIMGASSFELCQAQAASISVLKNFGEEYNQVKNQLSSWNCIWSDGGIYGYDRQIWVCNQDVFYRCQGDPSLNGKPSRKEAYQNIKKIDSKNEDFPGILYQSRSKEMLVCENGCEQDSIAPEGIACQP